MVVGEHAVKAAQKAYRECEGDSTESHRAALTAAPFLPVQGAVKKLEWFPLDLSNTLYAHSAFGMYTVWEIDGVGFFRKEGGYGGTKVDGNIEAAKAATQADYEARILSALEPSAARELALEEILREVDEIERKVWAWSGSAFLNNELEGAEDADCKTELYSELCGIGNTMHWLRTKICALSSQDHADAGKVEGDGWKPIESAPKDGTPVLIAWQAVASVRGEKQWFQTVAHYDDSFEIAGYDEETGDADKRGAWTDGAVASWAYEEIREISPTHWRRLPSAPASEGSNA
ncbi:hypothetical protein [Brucella intermedia]|uniref:hypothetical protein n=1 Tax=Brucella intermedia TaxID=94625 RepID=UPI00235ECA78|nr:hypothetical protein [Brucella intermedia]